MKKIKVAQIGTSINGHGSSIWSTLLKLGDVFEIVGYALPENEREKFPTLMDKFDGYREMTVDEILNDPTIEAVTVENEEIYLTKYAQMVADAGKHLHMEKPGGLDLAAFEKLVETLKAKNLVFSTGYMYRFNPVIKKAFERIEGGELGKIYSVEAQMNCKHPEVLRKWLKIFPGGMTFYLGCHLIDLIYRIQGEPTEIIPFTCSTGIDGIDSEDFGMTVFKYPNGVSFFKTSANECGGFLRRQLVIAGERGTIEIKPLEVLVDGGLYTEYQESFAASGVKWSTPWNSGKTDAFDRYEAMMVNFAELIRGKKNPYSYDYELNLYKLLLKCCGV
ncbi:MAG: Gfo/Idh/MocA family oxidoreductase [Ruminococcaceae bacterium]|nr:Gfo/Idh/MocA family oxidoreductase [Oscillospiraceae bacterium]